MPQLTDDRAITEACGLLDASERGKLALSGSEAKPFLQGQVTNDVEGLVPGSGCYAAFLTTKGKMLGDLRILDTAEELLLDCERSALQELFNGLRRTTIGRQVELHKRTLERGLLSLIGPRAREVAQADGAGLGTREHDHVAAVVDGVAVRLIATDAGGVDVLLEAAHTAQVAAALVARGAHRVTPESVEVLRVERGRPRYGAELDDGVIPQEAGLNARAVSFTKGCYVGQETVARLHYRGRPNRHLRGLRLSGPAQPADELTLDGKVVGRLATVVHSPRLGWIALALVRREAAPGAMLNAGGGVLAEVVELPFPPALESADAPASA